MVKSPPVLKKQLQFYTSVGIKTANQLSKTTI